MNKELTKAKNTLKGYKNAPDSEKMYILYGISNAKTYGPQKRYLLDLISGKESKDNQTALKMWIDTYSDVDKIFENIIYKLEIEAKIEGEK